MSYLFSSSARLHGPATTNARRFLAIAIGLCAFGMLALSPVRADAYEKRELPKVYKTAKAINYSPFRGAGPGFGEVPTDRQILQDLGLLKKSNFKLVRLFAADAISERILALAARHHPKMKFQLGIFFNNTAFCEDPANQAQVDTGIDLANAYRSVVAVSVGNETTIPFPQLPIDCLADYIAEVRSAVKQPVTTDQVAGFYFGASGQNPDPVLALIDFVAMHSYPWFAGDFWDWKQESVPAGHERAKAMMEASIDFNKLLFSLVADYAYVDASGSNSKIGETLPILITETGWKAFATNRNIELEAYVANPVNQKWYFDLLDRWRKSGKIKKRHSQPGTSPMPSAPVNIFAFEATDEAWKESDDGWGFWNVIRAPRKVLCQSGAGGPCKKKKYEGAGYFPVLQNTSPLVAVNPDQAWEGFTFVTDLPADGGNFLFSTSLPGPLLPALFESTRPGKGILTLAPNTLFWDATNPFWVKPDGVTPNKVVDASFFVSNDNLVGQAVVFSGKCLSNTLGVEPLTGEPYTAYAFIRIFDPFFNFLGQTTVPLVTGEPFTVSLDTGIVPGAAIVQYGFTIRGPVADPATVQSLGSVVLKVATP
ncbi:MAG: hypothetical protein HKO69_01250 [Woeseiaceae bacterium]|nr:hypothetical protein [Woeseiaceae bacterium]